MGEKLGAAPNIEGYSLKDNVFEYLQEGNFSNIAFVFAHPDDLEGYAGGLFASLATLQNSGTQINGSDLQLRLIVATDGANGTKNAAAKAELAGVRRHEQLAGMASLGMQDPQNHVSFYNFTDGGLEEGPLTEKLAEEFALNLPDLIITHDFSAWGPPGNRTQAQSYEYVQNHPDHRACARAVYKFLQSLHPEKPGRPPQLLAATWDQSAGELTASYHAGLKKLAMRMHISQYLDNQTTMDLIEDQLNNFNEQGNGAAIRWEFFRKISLQHNEVLGRNLLSFSGSMLSSSDPGLPELSLAEILMKQQINRIIEIDSPGQPDSREAAETFKKALIEQIRRELADAILISGDLPEYIMQAIDRVMMFASSLAVDGISGEPRALRILIFPDAGGNITYRGKKFRLIKGIW